MRSRAAAIAMAVAIVVVLVTDGLTVAVRAGRSEPSTPSALEAVLPELRSFVEQQRGLRFLRPVAVELKSDAAFAVTLRRMRGNGSGAPASILVGLFRTLGLVEGSVDTGTLGPSTETQILGVYDSSRKRLFVRGATPTPAVRRVLVHELTHALDDQHFSLDRSALDRRDDEAATAFTALVEGDAVRVETAYYESLSPEERRQADVDAEAGGQPPAGVPRIFETLLAFPYLAGRELVGALVAAGGPARVDAAFAQPPESTEQVIHPDRYLSGDRPKPVPDPTGDGATLDRGVLGELLLRLVLNESLDRPSAAKGAGGWGGDRYVVWRAGDRTCVRDRFVMDTPADRAELVVALRKWAESHPGATVTDADPVEFTRCA